LKNISFNLFEIEIVCKWNQNLHLIIYDLLFVAALIYAYSK
jgi:hypothetical protein